MKTRFLKLATLAVASVTFAVSAIAVPITAPFSRWSLFTDSNNPGWVNNYTAVSTTGLGTVKFLKYTPATQTTLVSSLDMSTTVKYASSKTWNNGSYQQISELGRVSVPQDKIDYLGQCVGFAKAMTGSTSTSAWTKLTTNALTTLFPLNGVVPAGMSPDFMLPPGTMIVNFDNRSTYTNYDTNHVAIVLSVVVVNGKVTGANVVSQNAVKDIGNDHNANLMITKYFLPWNNTASTLTSLSLKNYHVITAPGILPCKYHNT